MTPVILILTERIAHEVVDRLQPILLLFAADFQRGEGDVDQDCVRRGVPRIWLLPIENLVVMRESGSRVRGSSRMGEGEQRGRRKKRER
jgi:hypothetical protein